MTGRPSISKPETGRERGGIGRREIRHLFFCDLERHVDIEIGERVIGPRSGGDDQLAAAVCGAAGPDLDLAVAINDLFDRRVVAQDRAVGTRHVTVSFVRARGHRDAAVGLEEPFDVVGQRELRPTAHDLRCIEPLEWNAARRHRVRVTAKRYRTRAWPKVQAACLEHELRVAFGFENGP